MNVPLENCVQLGYYCMQLPKMLADPKQAFGSLESGETDVRNMRQWNRLPLPSDNNGLPTGENLLADLSACLQHFQPEIVVLPHPELDPHPDHIATYQALVQATQQANLPIKTLLLYTNHLHDNDRWPMGDANTAVDLPPVVEPIIQDRPFSLVLTTEQQTHKAAALLMQHDLQTPLRLKIRLRRLVQQGLLARRWPKTGDNEYLRKAVRKHELFWIREL